MSSRSGSGGTGRMPTWSNFSLNYAEDHFRGHALTWSIGYQF